MGVNAELIIQNETIRWVHETYPMVIITATANEHQRKQRIGSIGIPDLILFHPCGAVLFLELKTTKGRLSDDQKKWLDNYKQHGVSHSYDVAYGFLEAKEKISNWLLTCEKH